MKVLLIIPAYNEAENILDVVENIRKYRLNSEYDIDYVVINDCSVDETEKVCQENGIHYISLIQNLGIGGAVQTGYIYANMHDYDIAVQFDGDGQHDIESLNDLIAPIIAGKADFCIGSRFAGDKSDFQSTWIRRVGIKYFSFLINVLTGVRVWDPTSGFRAANKKVIRLFAGDYPFDYPEPESIVQLSKEKFTIDEVAVKMFERTNGVSSINAMKSIYYIIKVSAAIIFVCAKKSKKKRS